MTVRTYLLAIRKRWRIVVSAIVLGTLLGVAAVLVSTPVYVASVTFYVSTQPGGDTGSVLSADQFAQSAANSYATLLSSDRAAQLVVDESGVDLSAGQVASRIKGDVTLNTVLLTATVQDTEKSRALAIAQGLSNTFPGLVRDLDRSVTGSTGQANVSLDTVSGPGVAPTPVSPKPKLYVGLGLLAGLLVGLFGAVVRERFDTAVRSIEDLREITDTPLLAAVPEDHTAKTSPLVWGSRAVSQRAEAYRRLRTSLQFADVDNPVRVIVVTSSVPGEGKSSTSVNLALSFADSGRRTVVIEADLRRPKLADYFEVDRSVGLVDVLAGRADLNHVLQPWGNTGLYVLPSGSIPPNPSELLGSRNMKALLARLRDTFEFVVIDTPPVLPVTDAAVAATVADGVVFVVSYGRTKRAQVASSFEQLQTVGGRIIGTVFNMSPTKRKGGYGPYGDYSAYDASMTPSAVVDPNVDLSASAPNGKLRNVDTALRAPAATDDDAVSGRGRDSG